MEQAITAKSLNEACQYALPEELAAVRKLADSLGPEDTIVMIGAGPAVFALAMLERRDDPPTLYIIDIDTVRWARAHLEASACKQDKIHYMIGDSADIGKVEWPNRPISLLLVDGDHTAAGVSRDLEAWLPHMKSDGIVFCHDYLERDGGFNGSSEWLKGGGAQVIDACVSLIKLAQVGISIICQLVEVGSD